jgi:ectoine hydroxylase-related dioxygenase (phytanoyl-CoA dioxygenase family)
VSIATAAIAATYERDGFVLPIDVISQAEAAELRADLEAAEAELAGQPDKLTLLRGPTAQLLPSFAQLIRHPRLIAAVSQILGPDLMVWGGQLFIKEAHTPNRVTWHQDLTYWGLDEVEEVTAWVALSAATTESGCMRFVPGSHKHAIVEHVDTFADDNLLTRGQEIAVEVDEAEAVAVELRPGQASLHHGLLFHASEPNASAGRRIGVAIRYITPAMKQRGGQRPIVALVSGEDRFGHFSVTPAPEGRLLEADFERVRRSGQMMREVLFEGADPDGKR